MYHIKYLTKPSLWWSWAFNQILPEQSFPWCPTLQLHNPVVRSHCPFPLHGMSPPGQDLSEIHTLWFRIYKATNKNKSLPMHVLPSKPSLHWHVPVESSQIPWLEHFPSSGQSNSVWNLKMIIIYFQKMFHLYILEQSRSCRPASHVHSPVEVSHSPALLQSPGHVNSRKRNYHRRWVWVCVYAYAWV